MIVVHKSTKYIKNCDKLDLKCSSINISVIYGDI